MKTQTLKFALLFLVACATASDNIDKEISALKTIEDKKNYLEQIFEDDQKFRRQDAEVMTQYGMDSNEYKKLVKMAMAQDSLNTIKIEKYLKVHGHPKLKIFGDIATSTPSIVIHHSSDYETRENNFEFFYEAHLNGDIDIAMFLGRMYEMKFGKRFRIEGKFNPKEEIDQLIKALNLEEKKSNIDKKLKQQ